MSPSNILGSECRRLLRIDDDLFNVDEDGLNEGRAGITHPSPTPQSPALPKENSDSLSCEMCDFKSHNRTGLAIHLSRMHKHIPQLDGAPEVLEQPQQDEDDHDHHP